MFENELQWVENCVMCPTAMRTKRATAKQKKFLILSCKQEKGLERADSTQGASCGLYTEKGSPCALRVREYEQQAVFEVINLTCQTHTFT